MKPRYTEDWSDENLHALCDIAVACSTPGAECNPRNLMKVMWVEGRGARADAMNPTSSATGLIQWMGQKVAGVFHYHGHTRAAFTKLGVTGQLRHVRNWFHPHRGHLTAAARVYTAVFLPAFVKQSIDPNFVLAAKDSDRKILRDAYLWNKYFDNLGNKDGRIQVWELENAITHEIAAGGKRCVELFDRLGQVIAQRPIVEPPPTNIA